MAPYHFMPGNSPLLVSMPHVGVRLDPEVNADLTETGRAVADTDWYVDLLYDFLDDMGASRIIADYSRTVIDLNRADDGTALYPGQNETGLCPLTSFDGQPLYRPGQEPDEVEIRRRIKIFWQPYHDRIRAELDRIKARFGYALLWDAHSIKAQAPRFFDGCLPDVNLGTGNGASCDAALVEGLLSIARNSPYSAVLNGRFTGGYITRHYGDPAQNIHAVQLEISQATYMEKRLFSPEKAERFRPVLKAMIKHLTGYIEKTVKENQQNPEGNQKTDQHKPAFKQE